MTEPAGRVLGLEIVVDSAEELSALRGALLGARATELAEIQRRRVHVRDPPDRARAAARRHPPQRRGTRRECKGRRRGNGRYLDATRRHQWPRRRATGTRDAAGARNGAAQRLARRA